MSGPPDRAARIDELLADRATVGLSEAERLELAALGAEGDDSLDLAAAAVALAALAAELREPAGGAVSRRDPIGAIAAPKSS